MVFISLLSSHLCDRIQTIMFPFRTSSKPETPQSVLQTEVASRLMERLDGLKLQPATILDLGCGEGRQAAGLKQRYPEAQVVAVDHSMSRLDQSRAQRGRWRKSFDLLCADANRLSLAEASVDLLFSSLMLPFCTDLQAVLNGFRRVLKPGGFALFSTLGPDSLTALRAGLSEHDQARYPQVLTDVQTVGNLLMRTGFTEPVLDTDWLDLNYRNTSDLLKELRVLDPTIDFEVSRDVLRQFKRQQQGPTHAHARWEVIYASAWAPEDGTPMRDDSGGEVASISIDQIGRRQR